MFVLCLINVRKIKKQNIKNHSVATEQLEASKHSSKPELPSHSPSGISHTYEDYGNDNSYAKYKLDDSYEEYYERYQDYSHFSKMQQKKISSEISSCDTSTYA